MSRPAITGSATPVPVEDEPAATTRLGDGDGVGRVDGASDFDARGDGFTEDVGVGDTGTTVGLAVAVAAGFGRGVEFFVGLGDGVELVPITVIEAVMYGCTSQ
ncbi:MAG TPA: hypothetical protein VJ818_04990 [Actinomycetota bacterium]|nr:hypothetical protein [Actinomycetota bacterium]